MTLHEERHLQKMSSKVSVSPTSLIDQIVVRIPFFLLLLKFKNFYSIWSQGNMSFLASFVLGSR